jgi:hypothetical protein
MGPGQKIHRLAKLTIALLRRYRKAMGGKVVVVDIVLVKKQERGALSIPWPDSKFNPKSHPIARTVGHSDILIDALSRLTAATTAIRGQETSGIARQMKVPWRAHVCRLAAAHVAFPIVGLALPEVGVLEQIVCLDKRENKDAIIVWLF